MSLLVQGSLVYLSTKKGLRFIAKYYFLCFDEHVWIIYYASVMLDVMTCQLCGYSQAGGMRNDYFSVGGREVGD